MFWTKKNIKPIIDKNTGEQATNEKGEPLFEGYKFEFDFELTCHFLQNNGFLVLRDNGGGDLIRIETNAVKILEYAELKMFLADYVKNERKNMEATAASRLFNAFASTKLYSKDKFLEMMDYNQAPFLRDTADKAYMFYNNMYVEITKDAIFPKAYDPKTMGGLIWEEWKIKRDFVATAEQGDFERFIHQIATGKLDEKFSIEESWQNKAIQSFETAIGYMAHTYKNSAVAKAVIGVDDHASDLEIARGRTGKSLIGEAMKHIRNTKAIPAKGFDFSSQHCFQDITKEHQLVFFDDLDRSFDFESLFPLITGVFPVNPKNRPKFTLSFEESPKFYLSSNYALLGNDDSFLDRQHLLFVKPIYNARFKPIQHFKRRFFEDWDEREWRRFDSFICRCIQRYLLSGLIVNESKNYNDRQNDMATDPLVNLYIRNDLHKDIRYDKDKVFTSFADKHNTRKKEWTKTGFWRAFYSSCKNLGIKWNEGKTDQRDRENGIEYITLT